MFLLLKCKFPLTENDGLLSFIKSFILHIFPWCMDNHGDLAQRVLGRRGGSDLIGSLKRFMIANVVFIN